MKKLILFAFLSIFFFLFSQVKVEADSWWGDGARSKEWVLSHGGTIIKYKIIAKGDKDAYKAILYENGKVVEWENGKTGGFDDPKDGTYVVKAFKGGVEDKKTSKGGKKILSSGPIVAHPGETIFVTLNDLTGEVTVTSDRRKVAAKTVKGVSDMKTETQNLPFQEKAEPVPEKIEQFNAEDIGKVCAKEPLLVPKFSYDQNSLKIGDDVLIGKN